MGKTIGKRILTALLLAVFWLLSAVPAQAEEELALASQAAILMDADTGQVLYEKNAHLQLYPASITKIMTAMLALQELEPDQVLTVSPSAVGAVPVTSSHISLKAGEQLTVEQALYAIATMSANDAANVLAEAVSGSLSDFAVHMTDTARSLGAMDTNFTNANGLPDSSHYTTAYDMALITAAALKVPGLAEYFCTTEYLLPPTNLSDARVFANKDRLLPGGQYYYEGVLMAKTGWTSSAQGTFAAVVKQGDTTLVAITLKSPLLEDKYKDTHKLMDYGFTHYSAVKVSGEQVTAQLSLGEYTPVKGQKFTYLIPTGTLFTDIRYSLSEEVELSPDSPLNITVPVSATLGDTVLPGIEVKLERPAPPREAYILAELLSPQGMDPEQVQAILNALRIPAAVVGVLLLIFILLLFRRQILRYRRRKHLKARIRRMKKRME